MITLTEAALAWADAAADPEATRDKVLAVVRAYRAGRVPLLDVRRHTTGRERFVATVATPPGHPDRAGLLATLDELVATDPTSADGWAYATPAGVFTEAEIREAGGRSFKAEDGRVGLEFPLSTPWRRKPDRRLGDAGDAGDAVFRRDAERASRPMAAD